LLRRRGVAAVAAVAAVPPAPSMAALWRPAYVAVGSNLNNPQAQVLEACRRLAELSETHGMLVSRLYCTRPMGPQEQPDFVNAAVGLLSQLSARELLDRLLQIERDMGRSRNQRWGPRIIDLDLIWMVGEVLDEAQLKVPHPGVSSRNFVLYPLADIAPTLTIPGHGKVSDLLLAAGDDGISVLELRES
jgi:2-amino-4-hydroxy-6-hydroxymethyldihydropteridine diphosphokinase